MRAKQAGFVNNLITLKALDKTDLSRDLSRELQKLKFIFKFEWVIDFVELFV